MTNIGFIGIGRMGRWMAGHLLRAGHQVTVYDTVLENTRELQADGAIVASSVAETGAANELVITMLPSSAIVESVLGGPEGLIETMKPGTMIIDMSSSYALSTQKLAKACAAKQITLLDAPVSGGVVGAQNASLTIMVGGKEPDVEQALPVLKLMGSNVKHVGDTGAGHGLKAINNYLSATTMYATTEAMILAQKLGLDLNKALETINSSSGQSFSTHFKFPRYVLPRKFDSGFSLELMLKDVRLVTAYAKDTRTPVLLASLVEQIYETAANAGGPGLDHTEIVKYLEQLSDLVLEEKGPAISK